MTVAALPSTVTYVENGVTTSFAVPFRFKAATDLIVSRIADGVETVLVLGTDYTVTGGSTDAGGTVTRTAATSGASLKIARVTVRVQPMQYTNGGVFPAKSHEEALDRQMLIGQEQDAQLADVNRRALMLPPGESAPDLPPASQRRGGGKILAPNPDTGTIEVQPIDNTYQGPPGTSDNTYSSLAQLKASDISRKSARLVGVGGVPDGNVNWTNGDFSATAPSDLDLNIFASENTPLSQGAWVRQKGASIALKIDAIGAQTSSVDAKSSLTRTLLDFIPFSQHASIKDGTSTYDYTHERLQLALDDAAEKIGTVDMSGFRYFMASGVSIDLNRAGLIGSGANIDCSAMAGGDLFTVVNSNTDGAKRAFENTARNISGMTIVGPGAATGARAIVIVDNHGVEYPAGVFTPLIANIMISHIGFREFATDLYLGAGAFTISMFKTVHMQHQAGDTDAYAIEIAAGANSGERNDIMFAQFAGRKNQIRVANGTSSTFVSHTSLDYFSGRAITVESGGVHLTNCYIEANNDVDNWFFVTGDNSSLRLVNCELTIAANKSAKAPFFCDSLYNGLFLDGLRVNCSSEWTTKMVDGPGNVGVSSAPTYYANSPRVPIADRTNLFGQGGFETAAWAAEWTVSDATYVKRVTTSAHAGTASLEINGAVSITQSITRSFAVRPGNACVGKIWYKTEGLSGTGGTAFGGLSWLDAGGEVLVSNAFLIATHDSDWTAISFFLRENAPPGAVSCSLVISLFGVTSGTPILRIDDAYISII